jgi:trk system potassium uptake protein TrkA
MKFCVIGLGRLGYHLATVLSENGMEVMGVDSNESIVASIRDKVTQAICIRISDEESLRSIGIDEMDTVIVAVGENFAQSILITALLKKRLEIPRVITRAINEIHKDILKLVGADQVIIPEKEIGIRLADNLSSPFTDLIRLTKDFSISMIIAPDVFVGKKLSELDLYNRYRVRCFGIQTNEKIEPVSSDHVVIEADKLLLGGLNKDLEKIVKL